MSSDSDVSGRYQIRYELLAVESAPSGVLDPEQDVPFAVVWETQGTLVRLAERYLHTDS